MFNTSRKHLPNQRTLSLPQFHSNVFIYKQFFTLAKSISQRHHCGCIFFFASLSTHSQNIHKAMQNDENTSSFDFNDWAQMRAIIVLKYFQMKLQRNLKLILNKKDDVVALKPYFFISERGETVQKKS